MIADMTLNDSAFNQHDAHDKGVEQRKEPDLEQGMAVELDHDSMPAPLDRPLLVRQKGYWPMADAMPHGPAGVAAVPKQTLVQ